MGSWLSNDETWTIEDAEVIAKSRNGKNLLVESPILDEPIWVPRKVIHDNSEVYDNGEDEKGPGDLIVQLWWAEDKDLA